MQSWQNGQQANHGGQPSNDPRIQWQQQQQNFGFPAQNGQFDPNQDWASQQLHDPAFAQQLNTQGQSANLFENHSQGVDFLQDSIHAQEPSFHNAHDGIGISQQHYQQPPPQEALDPAFQTIHGHSLYDQQPKSSLQESAGQVTQPQYANQGRPQSFPQRDFNYAPSSTAVYQDNGQQQFSQQHLIQQQGRPQVNQAIPQQFDQMHGQQRQSPAQSAQSFAQAPQYQQQQINGGNVQYPNQAQPDFQQQQQQQQQQAQSQHAQQFHQSHQQQQPVHQGYTQSTFALPGTASYQNVNPVGQHQPISHAAFAGQVHTGHVQSPIARNAGSPADAAVSVDAPPKKRSRTLKSAAENTDIVTFHADPYADNSSSKLAEIDSLPPPTQTPEEVDAVARFNARTAAAKGKFPPIRGLPYLVQDGTISLPTPKSYDKLAPMVALVPRSGNAMVRDLPYELPCQIQGRFSIQYQPSPDKSGLDERRIEAKPLLDAYDRSMKAIGKRQPKYTEYPHAFKEQLRADEASKNKGKKLKATKPIRAETRPVDPVEAAVWDVLGIVHLEPAVSRSSSLIATRVQQAGDFFIKLRGDMNKAKQDLDQAQTNKSPEGEIARLTSAFEQMKLALYKALDAVIEHADDSVLDNMGGHQKFISSLVNVLIFCIKAGDFSGDLPKVALEMFTHMPMTKKIAETASFETVRKRFAEKGDDEVKGLAKKIATQVRKLNIEPSGYTGTSNRPKVAKPADTAPTTKRARDEDGGDNRSVKKVVVEAGNSSLAKKLAASKGPSQGANKIPMAKVGGPSVLGNKPRAVSVTKTPTRVDSPPTPVDDKSKSDAKKPIKTEAKPTAPKATPSTAPSAVSGIGSLLASISTSKPDKTAMAPKEEKKADASETAEQRAKRLRKEARRNLRVTWKPESELVMVKIFEKEESEDEGRAHNMIKDAADDRSEGMMLKKGLVEEEDDDDDVPYEPWEGPTKADWTGLPDESRNKHFVTRGGNVSFTTDEQQKIRDREQKELMVLYTQQEDIPPTPKSPPPQSAATGPAQKQVKLPDGDKFQETHRRWREEQQMGVDGALYSAMQRMKPRTTQSRQIDTILGRVAGSAAAQQTTPSALLQHAPTSTQPNNAPLAVGPSVIDSLIAWLTSEKVKNYFDPKSQPVEIRPHQYTDPETQMAGTAIEALVRYLSAKPYPATAPPDWLHNDQERVREWWLGYNKETAARQKKEADERARAEAEETARRMAAAAAAPEQTGNQGQDWAAWLAQVQQQQQQPQAPPQPQQPPQQQDYAGYMAMIQQMQQQGANTQAPGAQGDQLQAILAAMGQAAPAQPTHSQQAPPPPPFMQGNDAYAQIMQLAGMAQPGQQVPPPPPGYVPPPMNQSSSRDQDRNRHDWDLNYDDDSYDDRNRDQGRGRERNEDSHDRSRHHDWDYDGDGKDKDWDHNEGNSGKGNAKKRTLPPHKPFNKALIGTKPCTFWQQGKCARGDKCTFRHD